MSDDPGGNFASDEHRRVMAAVANPDDDRLAVENVVERLNLDEQFDLNSNDVLELLKDLEAEGDVDQSKDGWRNTDAGWAALTGPPANAGGRPHE